jgi:spermidine synthase
MRIADRILPNLNFPSSTAEGAAPLNHERFASSGGLRWLPLTLILFFATGCAALIYEVVWFQLLQLVIGLGNVSLAVVLGTYMAGMCLGSLLVPRFVSRRFHPLRVYAWIELGIALFGILLLFLVPLVARVYTEFMGHGLPSLLLRGAVAAICLLGPTILMGATLPVLSRAAENKRNAVSWIGFFYAANIVGAVFGCLLAGFYLLRVYDSAAATYVAAGINTFVALVSFVLAAFIKDAKSPEPRRGANSDFRPEMDFPNVDGKPKTREYVVYTAIGLSGMSALGAEVVWTRLLSLVLGGTVYTFSIVLAVFLFGLGIGSGLGSFWGRLTRRPSAAFGICQVGLTASIAWCAYMIACSLPYWPTNPSISLSPWFNFQLDIARCLWALLPSAVFWGASFPLALAAVQSQGEDSASTVGRLYAANTLGAIVGAIGFTLLVIPLSGTQHAEQLLIGLAAATAVLVLCSHRNVDAPVENRLPKLLPLSGFVCLAALLIWNVAPAPWGLAAYGRFMATYGRRLAPRLIEEKNVPTDGTPDIFCTYQGEGLNGTVAVTKWKSGQRSFHSAGKVQASNEAQDMRLQRMLGHISALAHNKPESVLVVACGAGVTAGSFVVHPEVKRIVICDIEPLVPKYVAPMFEKENYNVVNDPRTELVFDDGRHFVRTTKEKFDIITSDPIDPWVKGCAALNTVEYYQMCKDHLKPGGVMSLWIPLYESNSEASKSLIATFFQVFPNGILWSNELDGEGYDAVLFGQTEPTHIDVDEIQERLDRPDHQRVKQSLTEVGFRTAVSLLSTYAGRAMDLREWTSDAQINTDRNLRLQYLAGMWFNSYMETDILGEINQYRKFPETVFVGTKGRREVLRIFFEQNTKKE